MNIEKKDELPAAPKKPGNLKKKENNYSIKGRVVFGTLMILGLFGGVGGWSATAKLSGAVIAPGSIVVEQNVKKIQHRDGGVVKKIFVQDGDRVTAGQTIFELDDAEIHAELRVVQAQLTELKARRERLSAQTVGSEELVFSDEFLNSNKHAPQVVEGELRLFAKTKENLVGQKEQLNLQIDQLSEEITGIEAQREAKSEQLKIIKSEISRIGPLVEQQLVPQTRFTSLQGDVKVMGGEHGRLTAQIARAKGRKSEIEQQILSLEQTARLQSERELREVEAKILEWSEREFTAKDRLKHTKLYAPYSGLIHELTVHTIGGVITAAETIAVIVPKGDKLSIEARVAPVDIDQVTLGRSAQLVFSAFSQEKTPTVYGKVVHVSPDISQDPQTSQNYYMARIEIDDESKQEMKAIELVPGMPVEVFISTAERTALSFIAKPIMDQVNRAFREE